MNLYKLNSLSVSDIALSSVFSDIQRHECIASWQAHSGEIYSVQFSTDETTCFTMGSDGKVDMELRNT